MLHKEICQIRRRPAGPQVPPERKNTGTRPPISGGLEARLALVSWGQGRAGALERERGRQPLAPSGLRMPPDHEMEQTMRDQHREAATGGSGWEGQHQENVNIMLTKTGRQEGELLSPSPRPQSSQCNLECSRE